MDIYFNDFLRILAALDAVDPREKLDEAYMKEVASCLVRDRFNEEFDELIRLWESEETTAN